MGRGRSEEKECRNYDRKQIERKLWCTLMYKNTDRTRRGKCGEDGERDAAS